jgi:isoquinoline 1-oxidoreductase
VDDLATEQGVVVDKKNRQKNITYGRLAQGKRIERRLTGKVAVKKSADYAVMARPALRRDARDKVTGAARFSGDIRVPGMLYARLLRPPAHGARLLDVDLSGAKKVAGAQVVQDGDLVAVLHPSPDAAELALSKIKARYDTPASAVDTASIFDHLEKVAPEGTVLAKDGDLAKGAKEAIALFEETYLNDYVAHAPMEPHTALVQIEKDGATVWASTQTPFRAKEEVAAALGMLPKNVRVMPVFVGGGFGGKSRNLQIVEAARLAKLSGKPVQVAWTRGEEFFYDSFRPAAIVKIRSGITDKGRISMWDYHVYFAGERGAAQFYTIPNHSTVAHATLWDNVPNAHPFAVGPWRAPSNNTNTFARESQIDIMAAKAGADPVEFRLRNLADPKMQRVLRTAAEKFGWKPARAPGSRGFGIACGVDAGTYVAAAAEVAVERATGAVTVKRIVCVQDMGLCVNPEGAKIQMEGAVTMGLGYALKEQVRFRGGEILDRNFDTYKLPRFSWVPKIETVIIDDKDAAPQGGGEPAIVVMGAVLANAVHDAVGARMFQLPMTPERIKEMMKKS